jgi:hypothetical protein
MTARERSNKSASDQPRSRANPRIGIGAGEQFDTDTVLVVLVFWLTTLFAGFGLLAARNLFAAAVLCVCALTVFTAVFLILDMDQPLSGFMKFSA